LYAALNEIDEKDECKSSFGPKFISGILTYVVKSPLPKLVMCLQPRDQWQYITIPRSRKIAWRLPGKIMS